MGTFIARGIDVIGSPTITTSTGGNDGAGAITLQAGNQIWPDSYIIAFDTVQETGIGELNTNSGIVGMTVYASRADYLAGNALYDYAPAAPGQDADIDGGVAGLGDTYFRFNANVLVSSDPDAPDLSTLFVAPGANAGDAIGSLRIDRHVDTDFNGDGRIRGNLENGNGLFFTGLSDFVYVCFTPGAVIATAKGPVRVENLALGDRIVTRDNGLQPVRWIGTRSMAHPALAGAGHRPVRIRAHAFGPDCPDRDMVVSPNHRVLFTDPALRLSLALPEVLVAAKHLAGRPRIVAITPDKVTYIHLLFDRHEVILANGLWTESFQPGDYSLAGLGDATRAEILALFPELALVTGRSVWQAARPILRRTEFMAALG
jgi:Hint domain